MNEPGKKVRERMGPSLSRHENTVGLQAALGYVQSMWLAYISVFDNLISKRQVSKKTWPNEGQGVRLDNLPHEGNMKSWKMHGKLATAEAERSHSAFSSALAFVARVEEKPPLRLPQVHPYEGLGMNSHTWGLKTITCDFTQKWRQR